MPDQQHIVYPATLRSRDIGMSRLVFLSFFPHFLSLDFFPSYSSLPIFLFSSSCYGVGPGGGWDQRNIFYPPGADIPPRPSPLERLAASWPAVLCLALPVLPAARPRGMTHWVELVLLGPIWVFISTPFGQAGASEKTAESVVRVITF